MDGSHMAHRVVPGVTIVAAVEAGKSMEHMPGLVARTNLGCSSNATSSGVCFPHGGHVKQAKQLQCCVFWWDCQEPTSQILVLQK